MAVLSSWNLPWCQIWCTLLVWLFLQFQWLWMDLIQVHISFHAAIPTPGPQSSIAIMILQFRAILFQWRGVQVRFKIIMALRITFHHLFKNFVCIGFLYLRLCLIDVIVLVSFLSLSHLFIFEPSSRLKAIMLWFLISCVRVLFD